MLDRKLNLNGRIAITSSSSTILPLIIDPNSQSDTVSENDFYTLDSANSISNEYNTYVLQLGAQYDLDEHHTFIFDSNLTNVSSEIGNDRIVQLRYRFNF